jgi:hypothetical protein
MAIMKNWLQSTSKQLNVELSNSEMREIYSLWNDHGAVLIDSHVELIDDETEVQDNRIRKSRALKEALNAASKL